MKKIIFTTLTMIIMSSVIVSSQEFYHKVHETLAKITYNGNEVNFVSPIYIIDDKAYIPLREAAEKAGIDVLWDNEETQIILKEETQCIEKKIVHDISGFELSDSSQILNFHHYIEDEESYLCTKILLSEHDLQSLQTYWVNSGYPIKYSENKKDDSDASSVADFSFLVEHYNNLYPWWDLSSIDEAEFHVSCLIFGVKIKTRHYLAAVKKSIDNKYYLYFAIM